MLPDSKYPATILSAAFIESGQKGTPGIQIELETETGEKIDHTLWITENTRQQVSNTLKQLKISIDTLRTDAFWEDPNKFLAGKACSFTTVEEPGYNGGPPRVKVQWLNGPAGSGTPAKVGLSSTVAGMFRAFTPSAAKKKVKDTPFSDGEEEDVP